MINPSVLPLVVVGSEDRQGQFTYNTSVTGVAETFWVGVYSNVIGVSAQATSASKTTIEVTADSDEAIINETATWAPASISLTDIGTTPETRVISTPVTGLRINVTEALAGSIQIGLVFSQEGIITSGTSIIPGDLRETGSDVLTIINGNGATAGPNCTIDVQKATATTSGYLSSTDWNTFNNKEDSYIPGDITETTSDVMTITGGTGASNNSAGTTLTIKKSSATQDGYLSSTDFAQFAAATPITPGDITEATSNVLTIANGTGATVDPAGTQLTVKKATASQDGYLASADWSTFNGKQAAVTAGNLTEATSSVLTITHGTGATFNSTGATIQVKKATTSVDGYLSSTDWNTFNSKQSTITAGGITEATSSVLTLSNNTAVTVGPAMTIQVKKSSSTVDGYLSSTDWSTFNGKQDSLTPGSLTEATSSILTITGGNGAVVPNTGTTIAVKKSSATQDGYLSSTDWNTFNSKASAFTAGNLAEATSSVLTITGGTGAVVPSGGTSIQVKQAGSSQSGYLSSGDWTTFNNKQSPLTIGTGLTLTAGTVTNDVLTGKTGNPTWVGSTGTSGNLTLSSTTNVTKGGIFIGGGSISSYYKEAQGTWLIGIGPQFSPEYVIEAIKNAAIGTDSHIAGTCGWLAEASTTGWVNIIRKSRGTAASPAAISAGDKLGRFAWAACSSASPKVWTESANIETINVGTVASGRAAGNMIFRTATDAGPSVLTEAMRIDQLQRVGIGITPASGWLSLKAGSTTIAPLVFTAGTNLTTAVSGASEFNGSNYFLTDNSLTRRIISGTLFSQNSISSITNTNTQTTIIGSGIGPGLALPANFWTIGRTIRILGKGFYSTKSGPVGTIQMQVKLGSTVILDSGTLNILTSGQANQLFQFDSDIVCATTGATGTLQSQGDADWHTSGTGSAEMPMVNTTAITYDTTASGTLDVLFTWTTANASNTLSITNFTVEVTA